MSTGRNKVSGSQTSHYAPENAYLGFWPLIGSKGSPLDRVSMSPIRREGGGDIRSSKSPAVCKRGLGEADGVLWWVVAGRGVKWILDNSLSLVRVGLLESIHLL